MFLLFTLPNCCMIYIDHREQLKYYVATTFLPKYTNSILVQPLLSKHKNDNIPAKRFFHVPSVPFSKIREVI